MDRSHKGRGGTSLRRAHIGASRRMGGSSFQGRRSSKSSETGKERLRRCDSAKPVQILTARDKKRFAPPFAAAQKPIGGPMGFPVEPASRAMQEPRPSGTM